MLFRLLQQALEIEHNENAVKTFAIRTLRLSYLPASLPGSGRKINKDVPIFPLGQNCMKKDSKKKRNISKIPKQNIKAKSTLDSSSMDNILLKR